MQNTTFIFIAILSLIFLSACTSDNTNKSSNTNTTAIMNSLTTSTTSPISTKEKTMNYRTDHGKHSVTVKFVIMTDATGFITSTSATMLDGDRESSQYIRRFNSAVGSKVIGQKISSLSLSAVGGASDTTNAFIQAIQSL